MSVCQHRPDDGGLLTPCASVCPDARCLCGDELRAELPENRVARVPDSARPEVAP